MNIDTDWYTEGRLDGHHVARFPQGTTEAEWHATKLKLTGEDRKEYIEGFNESLDDYADQSN